ncbi:CPBP family intramembrane glutamic endopeptidase, partial [Phocaeicola paurosaccharolyticus]|uniref:CPBP family intramembrane glutamic endopeptidase n=1 Tax=Phocaeicola paurosaccharolyticus TaxID=732242 RepID=UPI00046982E8
MKKRIKILLYIQTIIQILVIYYILPIESILCFNENFFSFLLCSILIGVIILLLNHFIYKLLYTKREILLIGLDKIEEPKDLLKDNSTILGWLLFSFSACILEEVIVRYYLLNYLIIKTDSVIFSCILTSVLFSLYHFKKNKILQLFLMGIVLGILYIQTNNIIYPILAHFTNNL